MEQVNGTLRRELFDHVIALDERHLKKLISPYLEYYDPWRTHQYLNSDAPDGRFVRERDFCNVVEFTVVDGPHHVYYPIGCMNIWGPPRWDVPSMGISTASLQIHMLRAMWRELETGLWNDRCGHERGNPGYRQGRP